MAYCVEKNNCLKEIKKYHDENDICWAADCFKPEPQATKPPLSTGPIEVPCSSEWVPVMERLPENKGDNILACLPNRRIIFIVAFDVMRWPNLYTYWMPLPEAPIQ